MTTSPQKPNKMNAFIDALQKSDKKAVENLLKNGLSVDELGSNMKTRLMYAAKAGQKEIVEMLINKGANPQSVSYYGKTGSPKHVMLQADLI